MIYTSRHAGEHMAEDHHTPFFSNNGVDDNVAQQTLHYHQAVTNKTPRNCIISAKLERLVILLRVVA